ncbi:MAG: GtrA family protein [Treponema sp.]|jgi:putative flippase GtrA|nr:GtrA family protein [Treponema sp.]
MKPRDFFSQLFDPTLFRFILVGMVNGIVGNSIMFALYNFAGFDYWFSSAMNYVLASVLSFFLNRYFTFRARTWSLKMIAFFALTIAVSYLAAYSIARPLVYALTPFWGKKMRDNAAMAAGLCFFSGMNYLGQRFVVFRTGQTEGKR